MNAVTGLLSFLGFFILGAFLGHRLAIANRRLDAMIDQALHPERSPHNTNHAPAYWAHDEWWKN